MINHFQQNCRTYRLQIFGPSENICLKKSRKLAHTYGQQKRLGKPTIAKVWQSTPLQPDRLDYWWCQWPESPSPRRSYYTEVFDTECSLIEIAEDVLIYVYPNETDRRETSAVQNQALKLYTRLVQWKLRFSDIIPEEVKNLITIH